MSETKGAGGTGAALTRRGFLKTTAAAAGAAALAGAVTPSLSALAQEYVDGQKPSADEEVLYSSCTGNCFSACRICITKREGHVVKTTMAPFPKPEYNRICTKGMSHVQRIYGPHRLKYPLRRVEGTERGQEQWERISWDDAIAEIADKWKRYQEEYGKNSIVFTSSSGGQGTVCSFALRRLLTLLGGNMFYPNYDEGILALLPRVTGSGLGNHGNETSDLLNARYIIAWSSNALHSTPHNWHFVQEARENNGAKLVVIDPNFTATASKADTWVPVRRGTDGVLAMAMINEIVARGLVDIEFVTNHTVAPFLVKADDGRFLRPSDVAGIEVPEGTEDSDKYVVIDDATGAPALLSAASAPAIHGTYEVDGHKVTTAYDLLLERIAEYTPEYAADYCRLSVDLIRELAVEYATRRPASILLYYGMDHYCNASDAYHAVATLALLTGNIGRVGAGIGAFMATGAWTANAKITNPEGFKPYTTYPLLHLGDAIDQKEANGEAMDIKSLFCFNHNPIANRTDRQDMIATFNKIDFVVVMDTTMTDTARYADIVLPAAHWFEQEDIMCWAGNPFVAYMDKALEPQHESKSNFEVAKLIAAQFGYEDYFPSEQALIELALDTDMARQMGITYESLKKEKVFYCFPKDPFIQAEDGVFGTATKRGQFYIEDPKPTVPWPSDDDLSERHLPRKVEPFEVRDDNPLMQKYPLTMSTVRNRLRTHTQWGYVPVIKELEHEPVVWVNPTVAEERGIEHGDIVRVYNDRGFMVIKALYNPGVNPEMLLMPKGYQVDDFIDGHYTDLSSKVTDSVYVHEAWFDSLVEIEKYEEA